MKNFGRRWMGGGRGTSVLFSSDKPARRVGGGKKKKQVASSEKQCGIEWRSADRANPSAAGMSCAPTPLPLHPSDSMNG